MRQPAYPDAAELQELLDRWVVAGLITSEQAERIRGQEFGLPARRAASSFEAPVAAPGMSFMTEALGYLGGVVILVAAGLLTARMWPDLSLGAELLLAAAAAAALLAAGALVPERMSAAGSRLRAVLWLLSTVACAAFLALVAGQGLDWREWDVVLFAGGGTAIYAFALWWSHRHLIQQGALLVSVTATAAAATAQLTGGPEQLPGLAVLGVGVSWFALGWGGWLGARRPAYLLGAVASMFGAVMVIGPGWGYAVALATVAGILAVAVLFRDLALMAIGAIGALLVLPPTIGRFFPTTLAAPLALMMAGALLVAAALYTARRRGASSDAVPARNYARGAPGPALMLAGGAAAAVTAAVLAIGLLSA
jgi:hypothetical protein